MSVSNTDLTIGFDPTGSGSITGAQLAQMVTGAAPYADKGLIVTTTDIAGVPDVPSVSTYAKLARYVWIRVSPLTSAVTAYVWNPALISIISYADAGGLPSSISTNWMPLSNASIGAGAIQTGNIANGAVTDDKITSVNASKITGTITDSTIVKTNTVPASASTIPAGSGVIGGAFGTGLTLLSNAVETASIKDAAVLNAKLKDKDINVAKLLGSAIDQQIPVTSSSGVVSWTTKSIVSLAEPTTQLGKAPLVASTGVYALSQIGFRGPFKNLLITTGAVLATPADTVTVTAEAIMLQNDVNGIYVASAVNLTMDLSTGPAKNGRDTTAFGLNQWYYIWVCYDGTGVPYGVFSSSATAPSTAEGIVKSYSYIALVGCVARGTAAVKIRPFIQRDNTVFQVNTLLVSNYGVAVVNTWELKEYTYFTAVVPSIAKTMFGFFGGFSNNAANIQISGGDALTEPIGICKCHMASANIAESAFIGVDGFNTASITTTMYTAAKFEIPLMSLRRLLLRSNSIAAPGLTVICNGFTI